MTYEATRIQAAVRAICPDIRERVAGVRHGQQERVLWWELSACILSSQVPYDVATAAADALDRAGVLLEAEQASEIEPRIHALLLSPLCVAGRDRFYRFPATKAAQLARTHALICAEGGELSRLLSRFASAEAARDWLVAHAPGLGPKQASMFLRNAGISYDLAVIDRHVVRYMAITGLATRESGGVSSLREYRKAERALRDHADAAKCPVGIMDWAIWIVMRLVTPTREVRA